MKIKNSLYRRFLDDGIIKILTDDEVQLIISNIKEPNLKQAHALFLILYFTGARPNEVLRLVGKDVYREKQYLLIKLQGSKKGLPRTIYLPFKNVYVKMILEYTQGVYPDALLFYNYISTYERTVTNRKGVFKRKEISTKVYYRIKKWTKCLPEGITPYFLRHNRFSKLSERGISMEQLRMLKGSRTLESVVYYQHMSTDTAVKIAKKID